jgi:endonuclease-3
VANILSAQCTDAGEHGSRPACSAVSHRSHAGDRRSGKLEGDPVDRLLPAKTRSLLGMARGLVERHGGIVPADREALTALPGVGLKTANVVLGNALGQDALAVDTHVFRVSQRLGLAKSEDPEEIHDQLLEVLPRGRLTQGTHLLIIHGRRTCVARKPACPKCAVRALCPWPGKTRP